MMSYRCKWCHGENRMRIRVLRERMFGDGTMHRYEECADCGSLQLAEPALHDMRRLLKPAGRLAIRVPVVGGAAWEEYGDDWVQLDPPRHLCLPSERGFRAAAARRGLPIESITYDSSEFQFWGSELVRRGGSLVDRTSGRGRSCAREFPTARCREWTRRAREANARGAGDQTVFVLRGAD